MTQLDLFPSTLPRRRPAQRLTPEQRRKRGTWWRAFMTAFLGDGAHVWSVRTRRPIF